MPAKKRLLAWLWVALCTLSIFLIVPLARTIQKFVSARWGRPLFGYAVLTLTALAFVILVYWLVFRLKIRTPSNYLWLTGVAALYVYFTLQLWRAPEEAVHFLEYGLLGYFLYRALSLSIHDKSIYPTAFLIGSLIGIFDEILQWVMPGRYWDFRDAGLNALAAGLFQVALWKGIKPRGISAKIGPRAVRRVSMLLAANILLLGLCASNTPRRVDAYTKNLPGLSFLVKEEPMYEFTWKHVDPQVGTFFSRLTPAGLEKEDRERSAHWGKILRDWKEKDYALFLREHHPLLHAFVYEMRVHIYRRNGRAGTATKAKDEKTGRKDRFIALKENMILEKYFGRTLAESSYKWNEKRVAELSDSIDLTKPYRSPVSAGPFQVKEKTLWLGIAVFLAVLLGLNAALSFSRRPPAGKP
jgi:VanZ family protein